MPLVTGLQARAQVWGRPRGRRGIDFAHLQQRRHLPARTRELGQPSIGIRLKDQNGKAVIGSRVRVKLPDGKTQEGKTNADGELEITGISLDGNADITFLEHTKPGKAEAPEWPEEKEFKVTVVDEMGNPVKPPSADQKLWLRFRHGSDDHLVPADDEGVATYTTSKADSVNVTFESAEALAWVMRPIWTNCRGIARKGWVPADDTTTAVSLFGGNIVKAIADAATTATTRPKETLEPFFGVQASPDKPITLSVQPLVIMVRMLGELFDIDKCFLLPKAIDNVQQLVKLRNEYQLTNVLIVGHTDTSANDAYNLDLSLQRTSAMMAYLFNDAKSWYAWYGEDKKQSKRWGTTEDNYMIQTLLDGQSNYDTSVLGYRQWHNANEATLKDKAPDKGAYYETLDKNGKIDEQTRMQLIYDYMNREDTTVPDGTPIQVHGCGEFFPLSASGEKVDQTTPDGQHIQKDRRVEVFLFPSELGVLPPVPGEKASGRGEKEYPEWRFRAVDFDLLTILDDFLRVSVPYDIELGQPEDYELHVSGTGTLVSNDGVQVGACLIFDLDFGKLPDPCQLELHARDYHKLLGKAFSPVEVRVQLASGDVADLGELWSSDSEVAQ